MTKIKLKKWFKYLKYLTLNDDELFDDKSLLDVVELSAAMTGRPGLAFHSPLARPSTVTVGLLACLFLLIFFFHLRWPIQSRVVSTSDDKDPSVNEQHDGQWYAECHKRCANTIIWVLVKVTFHIDVTFGFLPAKQRRTCNNGGSNSDDGDHCRRQLGCSFCDALERSRYGPVAVAGYAQQV